MVGKEVKVVDVVLGVEVGADIVDGLIDVEVFGQKAGPDIQFTHSSCGSSKSVRRKQFLEFSESSLRK